MASETLKAQRLSRPAAERCAKHTAAEIDRCAKLKADYLALANTADIRLAKAQAAHALALAELELSIPVYVVGSVTPCAVEFYDRAADGPTPVIGLTRIDYGHIVTRRKAGRR